ncbi:hypothetical protein BpHYR1_041092 [Brachionus plicatilis]|uniref:Uncharacterized protein n=1 Tax=Brachionus plicatilis TaxID=10195 RepID=A0A3M7SS11_BRAPC|nr:hypothetical protein BpHYR1_041092 [Brachionus plicatilis]
MAISLSTRSIFRQPPLITITQFIQFGTLDKEELIKCSIHSVIMLSLQRSKYLKDYSSITDTRDKIGTALRQYMIARRNEEITCDEILLMLVYFRKFNSIIQKGIAQSYFKILEIDPNAFKDSTFIEKVYLPNAQELQVFQIKKSFLIVLFSDTWDFSLYYALFSLLIYLYSKYYLYVNNSSKPKPWLSLKFDSILNLTCYTFCCLQKQPIRFLKIVKQNFVSIRIKNYLFYCCKSEPKVYGN